ncbi:MAG: Wzz/FepE/Etk N-terminal domain-containing protein [Chitinophagales bacterium]
MAIPSFDLIDIIRTIQKQKRLVTIIVVVSMALAGVFSVIIKKKYKAKTSFFVNNPLYSDRSNIFRSRDTRYVDYFGGDDDLDKVTALAYSDTVIDRIIRNSDFQIIYKKDIKTPKGHDALMTIFKKNFNIKRTEYKDIQVSYIANDAQTAANVANMSVQVLEETYRHYYESMRNSISTSINDKLKQLNQAIDSLTDSLSAMRDRYGIYSIISPARENVVSGEIKGGGKGFGRAIEQIQNIESIKDQLVTDRAHYISTLNEFSATTNTAMDLLKVITRASPPALPNRPSMIMTLLVAGGLGFFFSVLYILIIAYFRKLNAVVR